MNMMKNKKGQFTLAVTLGMVIVVAVLLLLIFGGALIFMGLNKFQLAGLTIGILGFIFAIKPAMMGRGSLDNKKIALILIIFLFAGGLFVFPYLGLIQNATMGTTTPYIAFPHKGGIKCMMIDQAIGVEDAIPASGLYFTQTTLGFYSPAMTDINVEVPYSLLQTFTGNVRVRWKICDTVTFACNTYTNVWTIGAWNGHYDLPIDAIDFKRNTLTVWFEKAPAATWTSISGATISYNADKYGLVVYSTLDNPAGTTICSTSCDLTCPEQKYRQYIVDVNKNSLTFGESVSYFEYWDTVNYDINAQGGATAYNPTTNQFCLAGKMYTATKVTYKESGNSYIYPETFIEQKLCCPGANIATTNGYKICSADGNSFTEITNNTISNIECLSDVQCPGSGAKTCLAKNNQYFTSGTYCGTDKKCHSRDLVQVQCCAPSLGCDRDMTCDKDNKCVGGMPVAPINPADNKSINPEGNKTGLNCGILEYATTKNQITKSWYNYIGIGKPIITPTPVCKTSPTAILIIVGVFVTLIIIVIVLLLKKPKRKKRK